MLAAVLFLFPIVFLLVLFRTKFFTQPSKLMVYLAVTLVLGLWAYSGLAFGSILLARSRLLPMTT